MTPQNEGLNVQAWLRELKTIQQLKITLPIEVLSWYYSRVQEEC